MAQHHDRKHCDRENTLYNCSIVTIAVEKPEAIINTLMVRAISIANINASLAATIPISQASKQVPTNWRINAALGCADPSPMSFYYFFY